MPARKTRSGRRGAWDRFESDLKSLGRDFRKHYGQGSKEVDFQESINKLAKAAEEVFDSVGRASRDPDVREGTRKAARSFGSALAETFREVADELESALSRASKSGR